MNSNSTDYTNPQIVAQSKNFTALVGVCIMNAILAAAYLVELIKGTRSMFSYLLFLALCLLPCILSIITYQNQKDSVHIRYICSIGFTLLYGYTMFTTTTDLAFCYVIVIFVLLTIYTDMKLSIGLGILALLINVARIIYLAAIKGLTPVEITNAEIIIACLVLSCTFTLMSIYKIAQVNEANISKADSDRTQSDELLQLTLKVASAMAENIEVVSQNITQLRDSIATTQTSMEDLTNGTAETATTIQLQQQQTANIDQQVERVSKITDSLLSYTNETADNITSSKSVMQNLVHQVQISEASSTLVADAMNELKEYADKMQNIVALISNVASQTSLLSLNASIEAARAGEAGRGFSVVATEISALASQTNNATGDINQLIDNVTQSLSSVTASVEELLQSNQLQNDHINSAANYFDLVETNTQNILTGMATLREGVDTVADSNHQIVQSIENVSAVTEEVTASANATLSDCRTNLENVDDITNIMEQLHANAEELRKNS